MQRYEDLSNQMFGYLKVVQLHGKEKGKVVWDCLCTKCGEMTTATTSNLKCGNKKSCGCARNIKSAFKQPRSKPVEKIQDFDENNVYAYLKDVAQDTGIAMGTLNSRFYRGLRGEELRRPVGSR